MRGSNVSISCTIFESNSYQTWNRLDGDQTWRQERRNNLQRFQVFREVLQPPHEERELCSGCLQHYVEWCRDLYLSETSWWYVFCWSVCDWWASIISTKSLYIISADFDWSHWGWNGWLFDKKHIIRHAELSTNVFLVLVANISLLMYSMSPRLKCPVRSHCLNC